MATKLVEKGNSVVEVNVSLDSAKWHENQDKALKKLCENVTLKGFRKGKVPFELAKDHVSKGDTLNEAINLSLNELYQLALSENKLQPYAQPEVRVEKVSDDELEVKFIITLMPTCKLGAYKGLNIKEDEVKVTKEEIDASIKQLLDQNSELVLKEGKAELGDTVVLDFKGYVDGKEFDGGSANNYELVLGSNQFIPGFEDQLVGSLPETKVDVNVTFPEQYVKELAGKQAKFACTVHEVKTKKLPELNDEFVKSLNFKDVNNIADLEKHQEETLKAQKTQEAHSKLFANILEEVVKNSTFEISPKVLEAEVKQMKDDMIAQITQNGITFEQYKEITGLDDEKINENFNVQARRRLEEYLVLLAVANTEKITLTDKDLEDYYANVAAQYGMEAEKVKEVFSKNVDRIRQNLIQDKIVRFLIDSNIAVKEENK